MTTGITSILKNILKFITFIGAVVAAVFLFLTARKLESRRWS